MNDIFTFKNMKRKQEIAAMFDYNEMVVSIVNDMRSLEGTL